MKRIGFDINHDDNDNLIMNKVRRSDILDYSEELKLNIICDEESTHFAVLYCCKCETNLCKICCDFLHSRKSLSAHQIVRLTEKPETPIKCAMHPMENAKLICKEVTCDGLNKPMCTMCHQYESHKGHAYDLLDNAYDQIRQNVANCLKDVGTKQAICNKNVENCISSYEDRFVKRGRDEIDRFYSDARTSALELYDNFVKGRFETLKKLRDGCTSDKLKFDDINTKLGNIDKMAKKDAIECGDDVKELMKQSEMKIKEHSNLIRSHHYDVTLPNVGGMHLKIDISKNFQFQCEEKIPAVFFVNLVHPYGGVPENVGVEEITNGQLCTYTDGRTLIGLKKAPSKKMANLPFYKYIAVVGCDPGYLGLDDKGLKETISNTCWVRIIALMMSQDWKSNKEYADKLLKLAETDKRVEIVTYEHDPQLISMLLKD